MLSDLPRLLGRLKKPVSAERGPAKLTDLHGVRGALLHSLADCTGAPTMRLTVRITQARTHRDLWMLRSEAYRLISLRHCQSVAAQRIHGLLHHFEGWVEPKELQIPGSGRPQ